MKGRHGRADAGLAGVAVVGAAAVILLGISSAAWAIQNATAAHTVADRALRVVQATAAPSLPTQTQKSDAPEPTTPAATSSPSAHPQRSAAAPPSVSTARSPRPLQRRTAAVTAPDVKAPTPRPLSYPSASDSASPHPQSSAEDAQDSADD